MIKRILVSLAIFSALLARGPVFAGEDEEALGIQTKRGKYTDAEAVEKAKTLDSKYEKAKSALAKAAGIVEDKPAPKAPPSPAKKDFFQFDWGGPPKPTTTIQLKNGQFLSGVTIGKKDADGFWVEVDRGRVYVANSEVKEVSGGAEDAPR